MTAELGRTLKIPSEEAAERLLNMSPYQTNNLLYHIIHREEYEVICQDGLNCSIQSLEGITPASMSRKLSQYNLKILNNLGGRSCGASHWTSHKPTRPILI